jgi:hypothetical protein
MAGRKQAYGEVTDNVTFRVPKSRKDEFRELGNLILRGWKTEPECEHLWKYTHSGYCRECRKCGEKA